MAHRRIQRLVNQVVVDGLTCCRLTPIPHDRAQEGQIRSGKHAPKERQLRRARKVVGIVDGDQSEFGARRNPYPDTDHTFIQQHRVSLQAGLDGRDIGQGRIGAIHGAKDRVEPLGCVKTLNQVSGDDGPTVARHVAGVASPSVRA